MKWLLITTFHNRGDEFVRLGIQRLIREVDLNASFHLIDKEDPNTWGKVEFDRCVLCGMPLFWSHPTNRTQMAPWWEPLILGWPTAEKRKFLAMGIGNVLGKDGIFNGHDYIDAIFATITRAWKVTTRHPILQHPKIIDSICPAAFWLYGADKMKKDGLKLVNFMPDGAHEAHFNPQEAEHWRKAMPELAPKFIDDGFEFVAHDAIEVELALSLKFPKIHMHREPEKYAPLYSRCVEFIGNRLHGAVAVLGAGGFVVAIGYDSRLLMVSELGGKTCLPSEFSFGMRTESEGYYSVIGREYSRMSHLLADFAACDK